MDRKIICALGTLLFLCCLAISPAQAQNVSPVAFKIGSIAGPAVPNEATNLSLTAPTAAISYNANPGNNSSTVQPFIISAFGGKAPKILAGYLEDDPWGLVFGTISQNNTASMKGAYQEQQDLPING